MASTSSSNAGPEALVLLSRLGCLSFKHSALLTLQQLHAWESEVLASNFQPSRSWRPHRTDRQSIRAWRLVGGIRHPVAIARRDLLRQIERGAHDTSSDLASLVRRCISLGGSPGSLSLEEYAQRTAWRWSPTAPVRTSCRPSTPPRCSPLRSSRTDRRHSPSSRRSPGSSRRRCLE